MTAIPLLDRPAIRDSSPSLPALRSPRSQTRRRFFSESFASFLLPFLAYLTIGILLDFVYKTYFGDAVSRLANAFYVLHSDDPHVAAIGFVWNPLPSIVELPLLLFSGYWHALTSQVFAASICTAVEMAGAVYQLRCALYEWGVPRFPRIVLTILFAINPMILLYGGNGMSEALYLFTLVFAARYLLRWLRRGDTKSLVYAGCGLGLAYLTRYEAVGAALAAGFAVLVISVLRSSGSARIRLTAASTDFTIFILPVAVSFAAWAIASRVIVGSFFEQLSGVYGNASQEKVANNIALDLSLSGRVLLEVKGLGALAPLLPLLLIAAVVLARHRHDAGLLAPIAVIGGALGFDVLSYLTGSIGWFLRYFITAVPLEVLLIGALFAKAPERRFGAEPSITSDGQSVSANRPQQRRVSSKARKAGSALLVGVLALILAAPALPTTTIAMANPTVGTLELASVGLIFDNPLTPSDLAAKAHWGAVQKIANYITNMHLENAQVVLDTFGQCSPDLILHASNPRVFVITNDRDFQKILADPLAFNTHYLLIPQPIGTNSLDAISRLYPNIYANGDGFSTLVHSFPDYGGCAPYRLYRVIRGAPDA